MEKKSNIFDVGKKILKKEIYSLREKETQKIFDNKRFMCCISSIFNIYFH